MINKVKLAGTLILSLLSGLIFAQNLNRRIMEHYSPSVSLKLYNVLKSVPLENAKQEKLAELFSKEDSLMASAKIKRASNEEINSLRQQTISALNSILNQEELYKYYSYYALKSYQTDKNTTSEVWENFLKDRFAKLDSIKPISSSIKGSMKETFFQLCNAKSGINLESHFWETIHIWLKETIYYRGFYKDDINASALISATYWTHWYVENWKVSEQYKDSLYNLFYDKEVKIATLNYAYSAQSIERKNMIFEINAQYDSKLNQLLFQDQKILSHSLFSIAAVNRSYLKLSDLQYQTIVTKGVELNSLLKDNPNQGGAVNSDSWKFERTSLRSILEEEQYNKLLVLKNNSLATEQAQEAWKELIKKGFSKKYDSTLVITQLKNYFLTTLITTDFFIDDMEAQEKHLLSLKNQLPEPLKLLENNSKTVASKKQPYRGNFLW